MKQLRKQRIQNLLATRTGRRAAVGLTGLAVVAAGMVGLAPGSASAAGTADLGVAQFVSNGATTGQTTITDHVHNNGPSTANNIVAVALLKTNSPSLGYTESGSTCQQEPAPSGWNFMFTCQHASLASGSTWLPKFTITGTKGATLTRFLSVGASGTSDPSFSNNSSTLNTFVGSEADLAVSQKATVGASTKATIVATVRNHGPWTADALQLIAEINSPGFSGVVATSNLASSCQFIPPASGFNAAVSCTTNVLAPRKAWTVTFSYAGTAGGSLIQTGSVSANTPGDPVSTNNSATTSTHYGS